MPAPDDSINKYIFALVTARIICEVNKDGIDGFVIAGAEEAANNSDARKQSAAEAGKAIQSKRTPTFRGQLEADKKVDWSKESEDWSK